MMSMNHEQAIQGQAAERYLMGELQGPEREAYEEHFFDCTACAEEVKAGAAFARAARAHFAASPAATAVPERKPSELRSSRPSWFNWRDLWRPAPAFALSLMLLLAAATVYQNVVTIPRLRAPQATSFAFLKEVRTDGEVNIVNMRRDDILGLQVVVPPGDFGAYEGQITTAAGSPVESFSISAQQARQTQGVPVTIPAGSLAAGKYVLIVNGMNSGAGDNTRTAVAHFAFELQFQK